jgi:hypothetical protein
MKTRFGEKFIGEEYKLIQEFKIFIADEVKQDANMKF